MMVVHKSRHRRHVHSISIISRILEQSIVGVEQFPGQKKEELPTRPAVVQAFFAVPQNAQFALLKLFLAA